MPERRIPERYKVLEEVGQGGMAVVYRARDENLKREVAIKVLHEHLAADAESKARLEREAQAVAKLRHDNIVEIFDYSGADSAASFIVTEFIDGQTLKQFLASHTVAFPEVAALVVAEVAGALAHAHSLGILHRDVKPENVMIRKDGMVKLMDFGIAQVVDLQRMTVTGQLLGSPAYMAPELIMGKPVDFRSDVFSLGVMLFQIATGSLPFSGKNPHEVLRRITLGQYQDPRAANRLISDGLQRIITRALARKPEDRHADVAQLRADLVEYLADAGLGDVRGELGRFFCDPPGYERALAARMAAALHASAQVHLDAGRTGRALADWNRVLAFDPDNAVVGAALRRLEGRRRMRSSLVVAFGLAGLIGGAYVVAGRMRPPEAVGLPHGSAGPPGSHLLPPPRPTPHAAIKENGKGPVILTPANRGGAIGGGERKATPRPTVVASASPAPTPTPTALAMPAGPRVFRLTLSPKNVDVSVDGKFQFIFPEKTELVLPSDGVLHKVTLHNRGNCCEDHTFDVLPTDRGKEIGTRLRWKTAFLTVMTEPSGVVGKVDYVAGGAAFSRPIVTGQPTNIPFVNASADSSVPPDDGSKDVEIFVPGSAGTVKERITAGQHKTVHVKLGAAP